MEDESVGFIEFDDFIYVYLVCYGGRVRLGLVMPDQRVCMGRDGVGDGVEAKMNRLVCFLIGGGQWRRLGGEKRLSQFFFSPEINISFATAGYRCSMTTDPFILGRVIDA